ncbi:helix-turn-helix domain-containing protein [Mycobacteroides chelonae]|uniref:helix-turn-helix domain-containing protein n=1 Tax=Mycobacteroides chelonae TaxID=1774 RepID=UPI002DED57A5|nr:helix-turn-helix domain-containing protein [Mycobacteroides chelonae]MEC4873124.1 helix-turn-helix domain-containing protein [Mycobacteroides chelonae]
MTTYSDTEAAELIGCSVRWLVDQLRAGRFSGYKPGRSWRMTQADVEAAIECLRPAKRSSDAPLALGLTRTSRRRLARAE